MEVVVIWLLLSLVVLCIFESNGQVFSFKEICVLLITGPFILLGLVVMYILYIIIFGVETWRS